MRRSLLIPATGALVALAAVLIAQEGPRPERANDVPARRLGQLQAPAEPVGYVRCPTDTPADLRTFEHLSTRVPYFTIDPGTRMDAALDFIKSKAQVPLYVDWPGLEDALEVGPDTPLAAYTLADVSLETALETVLESAAIDHGITYDVIDGVVWISTTEGIAKHTVTCTYPAGDILGWGRAAPSIEEVAAMVRAILANDTDGRFQRGNAAFVKEVIEGTYDALYRQKSMYVEDLEDLIKDTVRPGTWEPDGLEGTLSFWGDQMIVRHTRRVQREVASLLYQIRSTRRENQQVR